MDGGVHPVKRLLLAYGLPNLGVSAGDLLLSNHYHEKDASALDMIPAGEGCLRRVSLENNLAFVLHE